MGANGRVHPLPGVAKWASTPLLRGSGARVVGMLAGVQADTERSLPDKRSLPDRRSLSVEEGVAVICRRCRAPLARAGGDWWCWRCQPLAQGVSPEGDRSTR